MAINSQPKPFLLPFILLILTIVANSLIKLTDSAAPGTMFNLIHRDQLPGRQNLTLAERVKQMLYRDMIHVQRIQTYYHNMKAQQKQQNVGPRRQTQQVAVSPMTSGYSDGIGEYFVKIMVGTPAKPFLLVADTGSDLTWFDCKYKGLNRNPPKVIFDADNSKSFKNITCSSSTCKDLAPLSSLLCPPRKKNDNCQYDNSYGGQFAGAQGIFGYETLTFDILNRETTTATNKLIGCTTSRQGLGNILGAGASGIMGLSNSPFSLPNQISYLFGNTFSYCLVAFKTDKTKPGKLFFGSPTIKINGPMQSTNLELDKSAALYGVNIINIYVDGTKLMNIPTSAWSFNSNGSTGTVIDSGSTSTYLVDSAYGPVSVALKNSLSKFKSVKGPAGGPFGICYSTNGFNENAVPKVGIEFQGGARLVVPGENYLLDVARGVKCLAFSRLGPSGVNIIGNLMQQNNLWMFDNKNARLSFGSSTCT